METRHRNTILILAFMMLISPVRLVQAQNNEIPTDVAITDSRVSLIGFFGIMKHFDNTYRNVFEKSNFFEYGLGFRIMMNSNLGLQFETRFTRDDNSWQSESDRSDNNINYNTYVANLKCNNYIASLVLSPFTPIRELQPYFRIGASLNYIRIKASYLQETKNQSGNIISTDYNKYYISDPEYKGHTKWGFILASGILISSNTRIDAYAEILYHAIDYYRYDGGVHLHGGIRFKLF